MHLHDLIITTINSLGIYGPILASLLIILESILPPLPLFVFITINFIAFGKVKGFILSWFCTIIGCVIAYLLTKKYLRKLILKKKQHSEMLLKWLDYIKKLSLNKITIVLAMPFTPAFIVNIAAGLANMNFKKFLVALIISKVFIVFFWGFIGTGLIESLKNPQSIIVIILMMILSYIVSLIVKKKFNID